MCNVISDTNFWVTGTLKAEPVITASETLLEATFVEEENFVCCEVNLKGQQEKMGVNVIKGRKTW